MANQGNRDREGNLGRGNPNVDDPTGTSGRSGNMSEELERNHQEGRDRNRRQDQTPSDDEGSLGSRTTNR